MSFFAVHQLRAGYGQRNILSDVSFSMEEGRIVGVIGGNGCGKTTLLKSICGILPHEGTCTLMGTALERLSAKQLAQRCSYIPQRSGISIDISTLDVVLMGLNPQLRLLEHPDKAMKERAREALSLVGLGDRAHDNYLSLSEGQKQLCIFARTLVSDGSLFLLDEPESALDFRYRYRTLSLLKDWVTRGKRGAIVTLHDATLALNFCDELLLLSEGRILGTLCPQEDPMETMEGMLSQVYGDVSLHMCRGKNGHEHLVMIKETEA